ncbi:MAG: LysM peptidoglycan-binding domain-containing protein [Acidimicrobiales bacterium]
MTALLTAPLHEEPGYEPVRPGRPELRLLQAPEYRSPRLRPVGGPESRVVVPRERAPRRRVSTEVRRRRTLLAMMGLALALLALPLSGSGGTSHTTGSTLAASGPVLYTVRAGDSLWSIAERMDPSGDPRPIVTQLESEIGSDAVVPGEQITLP